ncbi:MAG: DUF167 domain-containing protein [Actinobacteria bacterium]|nr:DUF167 domain-containing protein [Actinomycetota bacterium]
MSRIVVTVSASARESDLVGRFGDGWKVRIAAAPEHGQANEELRAFLARLLAVRRDDVSMSPGRPRGERSSPWPPSTRTSSIVASRPRARASGASRRSRIRPAGSRSPRRGLARASRPRCSRARHGDRAPTRNVAPRIPRRARAACLHTDSDRRGRCASERAAAHSRAHSARLARRRGCHVDRSASRPLARPRGPERTRSRPERRPARAARQVRERRAEFLRASGASGSIPTTS